MWLSGLSAKSPKPADLDRLADYGDVSELPDKMLASFEEFFQTDDAIDPQVVADDIASLIAMSFKERPLRTVSGLDYGVRELNALAKPVQSALLEALGMSGMDPTSQNTTVL